MILDLFKSKSEPNLPFPRCQHRSPAGRQCSQPICSTSPQFCFTHKPKPEELLIAELTEAAGSLSTPEEIHNFLTRVTLLRVQDRLTPKEACGYAYLCQILQRGQREIAFHQKLKDERAEREAAKAREDDDEVPWSIPRPNLDDPPSSASTPPTDSSPQHSETSASDMTNTLVELSPPASPVSAESSSISPAPTPSPQKQTNSKRSVTSKSSESSTSSTSLTSSTSTPLSPEFYNHFYPIDLTLPPGLQDPRKNIPPPDEAECRRLAARRGLLFNRRRPTFRGTLR